MVVIVSKDETTADLTLSTEASYQISLWALSLRFMGNPKTEVWAADTVCLGYFAN